MGGKSSKAVASAPVVEASASAEEVSLEIQDPPVNSDFHKSKEELYAEPKLGVNPVVIAQAEQTPEIMQAEQTPEIVQAEPTPDPIAVDVEGVGENQRAFVRRSSDGARMRLSTKRPQEMREIKANSSSQPKYAAVDPDLPMLQAQGGAAKLVGAEYDGVAQRRGSYKGGLINRGDGSKIINAETQATYAEVNAADIDQAKGLNKTSSKGHFDAYVNDRSGQLKHQSSTAQVANASSKPKAFAGEAALLAAAKAVDQITTKTSAVERERTLRAFAEAEKANLSKPAPDSEASKAALERARAIAKKSKYGAVEELPAAFLNAEPKNSYAVVEPPPKVDKAALNKIKQAHTEAAARQKKENFDKKKAIGPAAAGAGPGKHHQDVKKTVNLDLNEVAAAQKARAAEEAEFALQMEARINEQKAERDREKAEKEAQEAARAAEAMRQAKLKAEMKKYAAEKKAADAAAAEKAAADAKVATREAAKALARKTGTLVWG